MIDCKRPLNDNSDEHFNHDLTPNENPAGLRNRRGFVLPQPVEESVYDISRGRSYRLFEQFFRDVVGDDSADHTYAQSDKYFNHN